jgi:AraC-like DNA-binding protein
MMQIKYNQKSYLANISWAENSAPDLFVSSLGIFESLGDFYFEQVASSIACHVICDGAGVVRIDGCDYEASTGSLVVFFPGVHVVYYDLPGKPWRYTWFRLEGKRSFWALAQAGLSKSNPAMNIPDFNKFKKWLDDFSSEFANGGGNSLFPVLSAWNFINMLLPEGELHGKNKMQEDIADASRLLLEDHFSDIYTVDGLAEHFKVNRSTLFRAFNKRFGVSPKEYIKNYQFEKAKDLLQKTRLSVKEIAHLCGFEKQDYFSVSFRKKYKMTPSEWRSG